MSKTFILTEAIGLAAIAALFYGLYLIHPSVALIVGGLWGLCIAYYYTPSARAEREKKARERAEVDAEMERISESIRRSIQR